MTSLVTRLHQTASLPQKPAWPGHPMASGFPPVAPRWAAVTLMRWWYEISGNSYLLSREFLSLFRLRTVLSSLVRAPGRGEAQLVQGGLTAMIWLAPRPVPVKTCLKLVFCHWKMKAAAAPFSPSASNFTGPCTLVSVTPLCR